MKFGSVGLALAAFIALGGCQQAATYPKPLAFQHRIDNAQDWQSLAVRSADGLAGIDRSKGDKPLPYAVAFHGSRGIPTGTPVYVNVQSQGSAFAADYAKLLEEELMRRGYVISTKPAGATVLNIDTATYLYNKEGTRSMVTYGTFWSAVYGLVEIAEEVSTTAVALAAGPMIDALESLDRTTNAEVMITTSVTDGDKILLRGTETVYVPPSRLPLYWGEYKAPALDSNDKRPALSPVMVRIQG